MYNADEQGTATIKCEGMQLYKKCNFLRCYGYVLFAQAHNQQSAIKVLPINIVDVSKSMSFKIIDIMNPLVATEQK